MNALRLLLAVASFSAITGCAEAPKAIASPASIIDVEAKPIETTADGSSTLAKLVVRAHGDVRRVMVYATNCRTSKSVALLAGAGLRVDCTEEPLGKTSYERLRPHDVVVLDKAPNDDEARTAFVIALERIPLIATWRGEAPMHDDPIEVVENGAADGTHFALWPARPRDGEDAPPIRMDDLGVRPRLPASITLGEDGIASIVGEVRRLSGASVAIDSRGRSALTRVIVHGPIAEGLGDGAMARVKGRIRFDAVTAGMYVWNVEASNVDAQLDEAKMRALRAQHRRIYDRAVKLVARGDLASAADDLELAAKVFEDALGENVWSVSPDVRFDRTMALRLREVHAAGDRAEAMFERVTNYERNEAAERELLVAAGLFARAQLLMRYRAATTREEAEHLAHLYFHTVTIVRGPSPFPPPCAEMMNRFSSLRSSGGSYRAPRWKDEGPLTLR